MEFFPRHYSIPRDGRVTSIVVNNRHDLRRLRTELEILRRARRHVVFRCTPIGQAPVGMYNDADHEELETILHDAEHPLVEEMIDHIDRAFPNTRKEIMMSVVNDEAQNIVQEAVEMGAIEEGDQPSTATNEASADAAIDMLAEAEAKLAKLVDDSHSDNNNEAGPKTPDTQDSIEPTDPQQKTLEPAAETGDSTPTEESSTTTEQEVMAQPECEGETQAPDEATTQDTKDSQALNDMEDAVEAITEPPVSEPAEDSPIAVTEDAQPEEDHFDNAQPSAQTPEPTIDDITDMTPTDTDKIIEEKAGDSEAQAKAMPDEDQSDSSADDVTIDKPVACDNPVDTDEPAVPSSDTPSGDYGPDQARQAVEEIETGIRKLANVLNTQVKDQWSQASDALGDIVEKRSQLEQKLVDAKEMLEKLDRARKEAAISRDAADVARREAELFRDDLRKLRDDAAKNQ